MQAEASYFFKTVVAIVKQNPNNTTSINEEAKNLKVRVISFKTGPLHCVFSFNKVAYQIRTTKKGFECACIGITKN